MNKTTKDIYRVAFLLRERYSDFAHHNKSDPLDELLFIILSVKTNKPGYHGSYSAFRGAFPDLGELRERSAEEIMAPIMSGGLAKQKAGVIKGIVDILSERFDCITLDPLQEMTDARCEEFLIGLPGVGKKVARCVMMYSLGRDVFPVDSNCWRICQRIGWVRRTTKEEKPSQKDMDRLQMKIPAELRFSLHVNFVSLGREICTPRKPKCNVCPIESFCKKIKVQITAP